jgi:hypothetical protein
VAAADKANRTLATPDHEVSQILRQAAEADQREDREHDPARGDEPPAELASPTGWLARLEADAAERQQRYQQRVTELAAAARACGKPPRARTTKPPPRDEAPNPDAAANVTDPNSRFLRTKTGSVQGYNARRWSPSTKSW